ncbi:MAG: hypothetical protein Q8S33_08530 [Myxococcales bacterium]|nr:hypothetical protein [Myxococcales bacterium]
MFRPTAALLLLATLAACNNNTPNPPEGPTTLGAGFGASCESEACRAGLVCSNDKKCVVTMPAAEGGACFIGPECSSGICAPNGVRGRCAPAGAAGPSSTCQGDNDCQANLRCSFSGNSIYPVCLTPGTRDIGAECATARECLQGLLCQSGKCTYVPLDAMTAPRGVPPFIPPAATAQWQGATCPARKTTGPITALWSLPRETDAADLKQDFFRLPFPNDAHRVNGRVDFSRFPKDPMPLFGFDLLGRYLERLATEPFGNFPSVTFRFDGPIDFATISLAGNDPQLRFVDLNDGPSFGNGRGLQYVVSSGRNRYICPDWFALKPYTGDSLSAGTYAVIMKRGLKDAMGADVQPSADFTAMLATSMPSDPKLATAWTSYAPLRRYLTAKNLSAADLVTASVFTVGDPTQLVKSLGESVAATGAPVADPWVKCGTGPSPCASDAGVDRTCSTSNDVDEWHTLIELPIFQQGTTPYLTPAEGGDIIGADDAGLRAPVRREKVCASLTTPKGTAPSTGWPLVLYAHGTGGSFRSHALDTSAAGLANVTLSDGGTAAFAVLGFDQVGHGTRRGTRQDVHPNDIVFNFANPASGRGTMAQGAADLFAMTRFAKSLPTDGGAPALDSSKLGFWGHSQGASEGGLFLAFDRQLEVAVLTGASGSLADSITTKKAPVNIADGLALALGENPGPVSPFHPVVALLASWTDPVDALHFARFAAVTPADGMTPAHARHFFQAWGKGDLFTTSQVQRAYGSGTNAVFVGPKVDDFDATPVMSAGGNVTMPRTVTSVIRQYEPPFTQATPMAPKVYEYDGHFVAFQNPTARQDVMRFFGRAVRGEAPTVPEP